MAVLIVPRGIAIQTPRILGWSDGARCSLGDEEWRYAVVYMSCSSTDNPTRFRGEWGLRLRRKRKWHRLG
jgi:hypothetical protein